MISKENPRGRRGQSSTAYWDRDPITGSSLRDALSRACVEVGIVDRDVPADGRWHPTDINGDPRGRGDGRIKLFADGDGGIVWNWKGENLPFFVDDGRKLTEAERRDRERRRADRIRQAREEEARRKVEAAQKAAALYKASASTSGDNPYAAGKQVSPVDSLREIDAAEVEKILGYPPQSKGEPLVGRLLVVPVEIGDQLSSLQLIDEAGRKAFLHGGAVAGGYWSAQGLPDGDGTGITLLIGEGVATTLSAREVTGHLAVAALYSGNLLAVARAMSERYPKSVRGVLADLGNGQKDAEKAAQATDSALVLPDFGANPPDDVSDFNDMHQHRGLEAVHESIAAQIAAHAAQEDARRNTADAKTERNAGDTKIEPRQTDLGNAHRFARDHHGNIRYCWPWSKWLVWNGRFWARDETGEIHRLAERTVRAMYAEAVESPSPERREALVRWALKCESHERRIKMLASAQAIEGIPIRPGDLDRDPWLLNVRNGTIDLRTGTLRAHVREDYITRCLDVDYDSDAKCPAWERFLSQVFADAEETIAYVQRAIGYGSRFPSELRINELGEGRSLYMTILSGG
jgi:phage/plasmid primase-like uncharacterized protein